MYTAMEVGNKGEKSFRYMLEKSLHCQAQTIKGDISEGLEEKKTAVQKVSGFLQNHLCG
jgi:hypothetical protein